MSLSLSVPVSISVQVSRQFGIRSVNVTTLQAVSGGGYPGISSLDILGNVIPFIGGEEEKLETETKKILGTMSNGCVKPHSLVVSAHTTRVPVINGHTEMISIGFKSDPSADDILSAFREFKGRPQEASLPTAAKSCCMWSQDNNTIQNPRNKDESQKPLVYLGPLLWTEIASRESLNCTRA